MAKSCKFQEEMVAQFLSRLPPKALLRFKCVRKSWYNLISSPMFVVKNLSNSVNNKFTSSGSCILFKRTVLKDNTIKDKREIFFILRDGSTEKKENMLSLLDLCNNNCCDDQNLLSVVEDLIVPLRMSKCPFHLYIAGHCDGIICLNGIGDDILLCNPAIKEFIYLPESCLLLPPNYSDDSYDSIESNTHAVGFGYDSKAKSYKVVRIVEFSGHFINAYKRAEVCTLGAISWREIEISIQKTDVRWTPCFVIYFNGISYWTAYTQNKEFILSFNMSDELFHEIPLPDCFLLSNGWSINLAVMKESVVVLTYGGHREVTNSLDIWMMDDTSSVKGLWTKYLTFILPEGLEIPLVFLNTDELLMVTTDGHVVSYNFTNQKRKYLPIHGDEDPSYILAVLYVKSIVSVKGYS